MEAKSSSGTPLPLVQSDWSPVATVRCDYQSAGRREDGKYVEHDTIPHLCHIELDEAYVEVSLRRLEKLTGEEAVKI
jgi:hypothetical protein